MTSTASYIIDHKYTIIGHIIAWMLAFILDYSFVMFVEPASFSISSFLKNSIFNILFFYASVHLVFLRFLPNNVILTMLFQLIIIVVFISLKFLVNIYIIGYSVDDLLKNNNGLRGYISRDVYRYISNSFYALAYWAYLQKTKEQRLRYESELAHTKTREELLNTEINFLKAQINPHFLFNTLNFLFAETYKLSPKLSDAIMLLTNIMRHTVTSTNSDTETIEQEADFLDDYLKIQQLRFRNNLYVNFQKQILVPNNRIPPLVLLTFVENAFKFGKINDSQAPIEIKLISNHQGIEFTCTNLKSNARKPVSTSVGQTNIKNRLKSFDKNYSLDITDEVNSYTVHLKISAIK